MNSPSSRNPEEIAGEISRSGLSVFDSVDDRPELFYPLPLLERRLRDSLRGLNLSYPIRTRSKVVKQAVCRALGYPEPDSFPRIRPRLPGQDLDVYVQTADNLQIWNEEVSATRRYALIRPDASGRVVAVRVVTGETLAALDLTGTLTSKYQASRRAEHTGSKLVSDHDTEKLRAVLGPQPSVAAKVLKGQSASDQPAEGAVLAIASVYRRFSGLIGRELEDPGLDQERLRGEALQRLAAEALGLGDYWNRDQWPDILCQAIELKLQTARTIDLGLIPPDSEAAAQEIHPDVRHRDVRYAVFYAGRVSAALIRLDEVVVSTGEDFFAEFQRFEGKVQNTKLQIPLPDGFFADPE